MERVARLMALGFAWEGTKAHPQIPGQAKLGQVFLDCFPE
jgi:hypothetical protein